MSSDGRNTSIVAHGSAANDRSVLCGFYDTNGGPEWLKRTRRKWKTSEDISHWSGVTVNAEGRVIKLDLSGEEDNWDKRNRLTGSLPAKLGELDALEELNLSCCQLTGDIPRELARLGRLRILDLSHNKLTGEIPPELGQLVELEELQLASNQLTGNIPRELARLGRLRKLNLFDNKLTGEIPPELGQLVTLEELVLSFNQLSGDIPEELGQLTALMKLYLDDNQLTGEIPPKLGQLVTLKQLDLADNQLTGEIPPELGELVTLKELLLGNNQLTGDIPEELGQLTALTFLVLDSNRLTGGIPPKLGQLVTLKQLDLADNQLTGIPKATAERFARIPALQITWDTFDGVGAQLGDNPWTEPSEEVVRGGWAQIVSYYEALERSGATTSHKLKMVLVGAVCAGKTTLTRGLLRGAPDPTKEGERTRGVDVHIQPWRPNPAQPLEVAIWDFAGHCDYYSTHQLFLTEGALQLLVVDLHKFCRDSSCRGDAVYIWLDALLCRLPACAVLVVATHGDCFGDNRGEVDAALSHLQGAISEYMEDKREEWNRAVHMQTNNHNLDRSAETAPSLRICGVVEASGRSPDDLCRLRDKICSLVEEVGPAADGKRLFPSVGQTVPVSWARVWRVMEALQMGADPFVAVQSIGQPVDPIEGLAKHEFVTWEYAVKTWTYVVSRLKLATEVGGSPKDGEEVLKAALTMRQIGGTMLVTCGLVHLNPSWINDLLRALLDHDLVDPTKASEWRAQLMAFCHEKRIAFDELVAVHRKFVNAGRLTKPYIGFLWRKEVEPDNKDVIDRMISTMAIHGAMFRCALVDDDHGASGVVADGDELMVPARLPVHVGDDSLLQLKTVISHGVRMQIVVDIWSKYVPAGLVAQFVGTFCDVTDIDFHSCWNRGATFAMRGLEYLVCLHDPRDDLPCRIEIDIAGSTTETVNKPGRDVRDALVRLLKRRYPGLQFDASGAPRYMVGVPAWRDSLDNLEEHLERIGELGQNLGGVLHRILDAFGEHQVGRMESQAAFLDRMDNLVHRLDDLRTSIGDITRQQLDNRERTLSLLNDIGSKIDGISVGGLTTSERTLLTSVASNVASLRWPVPRLACLLPACLLPEHDPGLTEDERGFPDWSTRLETWSNERQEAGIGTCCQKLGRFCRSKDKVRRKLRLFFLCAHDLSLAECGPDGQGYEVTELLQWVKQAMPLINVGMILGGIVLKTCTGLSIPTDQFEALCGITAGGAVSEMFAELASVAGEELITAADNLSNDEKMKRLRGSLDAKKVNPCPAAGSQYYQLTEAVRGFELEGLQANRRGREFRRYDEAMKLVDEHGHGLEWAWVRHCNVDEFRRDRSTPSHP